MNYRKKSFNEVINRKNFHIPNQLFFFYIPNQLFFRISLDLN